MTRPQGRASGLSPPEKIEFVGVLCSRLEGEGLQPVDVCPARSFSTKIARVFYAGGDSLIRVQEMSAESVAGPANLRLHPKAGRYLISVAERNLVAAACRGGGGFGVALTWTNELVHSVRAGRRWVDEVTQPTRIRTSGAGLGGMRPISACEAPTRRVFRRTPN